MFNVDPSTLQPNPWNPNRVDPINQEKLQASMEVDGQKLPVLVRKDGDGYQIIDGQHRVEAAKALGIQVFVHDLGKMTEAQAKKATLIANSRYGDDDPEALIALLSSEGFDSAEMILTTLPIDETELSNLFASVDTDFSDLEDDDLDQDSDDDLDMEPGISTAGVATEKIIRFKIPIDDAERLEAMLDSVIEDNELTEKDKLRVAGQALMMLIPEGDNNV
jgi:ParB family chromosome partitioning protein